MNQRTEIKLAPPAVDEAAPPPKTTSSRAKVLLPALAAIAAAGAGAVYLFGRGHETTDDAQVEGHVSMVAARMPGQVKRVLVKDNQAVKAGEVLVELDDRDLAAR